MIAHTNQKRGLYEISVEKDKGERKNNLSF